MEGSPTFRLGDSGDQRVLLREGKPVPLTPKVFDTLLILVENSGQIVEKEELMRRLWPNTFVEEGNLTVNTQLSEVKTRPSPKSELLME